MGKYICRGIVFSVCIYLSFFFLKASWSVLGLFVADLYKGEMKEREYRGVNKEFHKKAVSDFLRFLEWRNVEVGFERANQNAFNSQIRRIKEEEESFKACAVFSFIQRIATMKGFIVCGIWGCVIVGVFYEGVMWILKTAFPNWEEDDSKLEKGNL